MKTWRVVYGLEVPAESAEAAYLRTSEFVAFLLERKAAGHPQLRDIHPVLGIESQTYEVGPP